MAYKKVVVFTPMEILEVVNENTKKIHEDILKDMIDENIWVDYEASKQNVDKIQLLEFYNERFSRASYLSREVGFSILYETEAQYMFYIGDIITNEMMDYIDKNCQDTSKYLSFVTWFEEGIFKKYYGNEMNQLSSRDQDFQRVMLDLKQVLGSKQESHKKSI